MIALYTGTGDFFPLSHRAQSPQGRQKKRSKMMRRMSNSVNRKDSWTSFLPPRKNKKRKAIDAFRLSEPINKPLNQVLAAYEARRTKDTTDEVSEQQMIEERFIIFVCSFLWNRLIIACTGFFVNTFLRKAYFAGMKRKGKSTPDFIQPLAP